MRQNCGKTVVNPTINLAFGKSLIPPIDGDLGMMVYFLGLPHYIYIYIYYTYIWLYVCKWLYYICMCKWNGNRMVRTLHRMVFRGNWFCGLNAYHRYIICICVWMPKKARIDE
jgi:hypothetical protein